MRSLRAALTLGTTLGMAALLAVAGALLYVLVRSDLLVQFDQALIDSARLLASTMEQGPRKLSGDFHKYDMREFETPERPGYLEVWLADGSVFFRSPSLALADLDLAAGPMEAPVYGSLTLPDGRPGRAVGITFVPRPEKKKSGEVIVPQELQGQIVTLVLARGVESVAATLRGLAAVLGGVGLAAIVAAGGVLWVVIRRTLRPVRALAIQLTGLDAQDLSARIAVQDIPEELQPVTDRLNELLGRLEDAFGRERALSANVAHELRTPLAGLRSTLEVAVSRTRSPDQYQEALGDCLQITAQMQDLVENLLSLARLEAGQIESAPEPVLPNELLIAAWKPLEAAAMARRLTIQWALGPPDRVVTDPSLLSLVIRNLLENAVAHAEEGGAVKIETTVAEEKAEIRIRNSSRTLPPEEVERVFERFWRGDAARQAAGNHCGLGLALVKKTVAVLGGSVAVQSTADGEFVATVSISGRPAGR